MQILPLIQRRTQSVMADAAATGGSGLGSRQSALFASLLDSARADSASKAAVADLPGKAAAEVVSAAVSSPTEEDIKSLPVTREDIAALRSELKDQGFADEELDAMEAKAGDGKGMTWGELLDEVEKKVASSGKGEKKAIANDDQVQILGLLGKLGFTADQSQQMVEALSRGETQSVMSAISEKLAGLSDGSEITVGASEITALGRAMNLSEEAQSRLASLMDASSGQAGQDIASAMSLVKNELLAKTGLENQKMAEFREAASGVLQNAWQRDATGRSSDLYQDDVARKAGQVVAMSHEEGDAGNGLDALADVPQEGQGVASEDVQAGVAPAAAEGETAAPADQTAKNAGTAPAAPAELAGKAGAVAAQQAGLAEASAQATSQTQGQAQPQAQTQAQTQVQPETLAQQGEAASTSIHGAQAPSDAGAGQQGTAGGNAFGFAHGGQSGQSGLNGQTGQSGHDESMAELLGKIRFAGRAGSAQTTTGQTAETAPTLAAMDALKTSQGGQQAKNLDPALAARVAKQVESGILKSAGQEAKQLTLNLTPDELGKVQVTLTVKDKEVRAVISADNADTTAMLQEHASKIKQSLEEQGFKVSEVEVRSQLSQDNQTASWDSPERHNEARQQREALERIRSSVRLAREAAAGQGESLIIPEQMTARASGLDLFA
jgi:flagellar hook-length control protein FliK